MKKTGFLALIQPFMKSVQNVNNKELNEALNELYLEQEDYDSLKASISTYTAFDSAALAKQCENHELAQFRRIAAFLYRRAKQYEISMKISMKDQEYRVKFIFCFFSKKSLIFFYHRVILTSQTPKLQK